MKAKGTFSMDATSQLSITADVTCKADFCGVPVANGQCCEGEELFDGKCYAGCSAATGGSHPVRQDACTCKIATECTADEEKFEGFCYRKCSLLTTSHTKRTGPNTCEKTKECEDNEEKWNGQ